MPAMAGMAVPRSTAVAGVAAMTMMTCVTGVPMSAGIPVMSEAEEGHDCEPGYPERKAKPVGAHMRG